MNDCETGPGSNRAAKHTEATEPEADNTAEQALSQLHTLDGVHQPALLSSRKDPVPAQSMLLYAELQDTPDVKQGPVVNSERTKDKEALQPPAAALPQETKRSSSRIDSLLDAMLA